MSERKKKTYNKNPKYYIHTHAHIRIYKWLCMQDGRSHLNSFKEMRCIVSTRMIPHHKDTINSKLPKYIIRVCCG